MANTCDKTMFGKGLAILLHRYGESSSTMNWSLTLNLNVQGV